MVVKAAWLVGRLSPILVVVWSDDQGGWTTNTHASSSDSLTESWRRVHAIVWRFVPVRASLSGRTV